MITARTDALVNQGLVALGGLAIVDNIVTHRLLGVRRALSNPDASLPVEVGLGGVGMVLLGSGARAARPAPRRVLAEGREHAAGSDAEQQTGRGGCQRNAARRRHDSIRS
ncbi:MAG: hypothetical protein ACRDT6_06875 [Micromonosporaceae bacterium]